jgi:hypothetical protein
MSPRIALSLLLICLVWSPCLGQTNTSAGALTGRITVSGSSQAAVQDAEVTATNTETGETFASTSDDSGVYQHLVLPPGNYDVRVQMMGFQTQLKRNVQITVGESTNLNFSLTSGAISFVVDVREILPMTDPGRTQQSTNVREEWIHRLPIDQRNYLAHVLLAPGVADSEAFADSNDFRVVQAEHSGLSFFGSNGRGNSIRLDGGERDTAGGGVRPTLSQEAIREFQINRANYSAESGSATGAVINIVSKSGTNFLHGSAFAFFRDDAFDAGDPFARTLINGESRRIKPPSNRQQFGLTLGGPLKVNRTFFFTAFEGLRRRESNSVPVLTDLSIFEPTAAQEAILATLPSAQAQALRQALTATPETRNLFEVNNGVFPFRGSDYKTSLRLDHRLRDSDQFMLSLDYANIDETNPNTRALVGISRGFETSRLDGTGTLAWTHTQSSDLINQLRFQFGHYRFSVATTDKFGPELNIDGFGYFNREIQVPSINIFRRSELSEVISFVRGSHVLKAGGQVLIRNTSSESHVFMGGRFNFGSLPGGLVSPALASTSITSLQAFNLGLPQAYQQGFGAPTVSSTDPYFGVFVQDKWAVNRSLTVDLGLRYELDDRRDPLPTDTNNVAPRVGFAWKPWQDRQTTVRGGYGIFYAPTYYFVDWVANALNIIDGHRQIAQVLTTIQTPGAPNASNIFRTLRAQGVITLPTPTQPITAAHLEQFGIQVTNDGPVSPFSVLFRNADDLENAYSQQASFGVEHTITPDFVVDIDYLFARTLKIIRARDDNLLPAPISPTLGIPVWSTPYFRDPLRFQDNVYESTGRAFYHGLTVELKQRLRDNFSVNASYTLSKAIDEVTDFNSDFQANDQTNLRAERALSSFDQRHKVVAYALVRTPRNRSGWLKPTSNFLLTPVFRFNSSRPLNLLVGSDLNGDRHSTTDRPIFAGRNTGRGPSFWTFDLRVTREIDVTDTGRLEVIAEAFNLFNRLNFRSVNNIVGNMPGPFDVRGRADLAPSQPLAFTSASDARRFQFGFRFSY